MNLSPDWVGLLREAGHEADHWSAIGSPDAPDSDVMAFTARRDAILVTSDLDFGAILAASGGSGPSVIQIRSAALDARKLGSTVLRTVRDFEADLTSGVLLTIDFKTARVRSLPIERRPSTIEPAEH